jgi:hypothetical protein
MTLLHSLRTIKKASILELSPIDLKLNFVFTEKFKPKDPALVPRTDRTFFFISGRYVRDTMCNSVFFFQLFRVHFHTI